ncbi:pentapeptide repeat-containing protein [Kineococcus xinjiangensis]|uniref:pentapeptide repeat-containing protein n=1 Tax=Kineococcus xinjiangensis TaxID=512762 RepID=UPI001B802398|nr:pentapeptide repeat-containing protein [Kineococcus xinjiangensis]
MSTAEEPTGGRQELVAATYGQQLRRISFAGADLTSVRAAKHLGLDRCSFAGADLRHATLEQVFFKMCDLRGADLRAASLRGVRFAACDLRGADLRGADLHGASFGRVNTGDDTGRTLLTGARLDPGALDDATVEPGTALPSD